MRTEQEILARIKAIEKEDWLGFQTSDLLDYVSYKAAKHLITEDGRKKFESGTQKWTVNELSREHLIKVMTDYMEFALGKAEDHRGISAGRSINHFQSWIWLLGDEDYNAINWEAYVNYGVPILKQICDKYKIKFPLDNKYLVNMSMGIKCHDECEEGCGRG